MGENLRIFFFSCVLPSIAMTRGVTVKVHDGNSTPSLGSPVPVFVRKLKRILGVFGWFFKIDLCSKIWHCNGLGESFQLMWQNIGLSLKAIKIRKSRFSLFMTKIGTGLPKTVLRFSCVQGTLPNLTKVNFSGIILGAYWLRLDVSFLDPL